MKSLAEQLHEALVRSGMTVAELLAKSGLKCERATLQRKLTGSCLMRTTEAELLANVLGVTLAWVPQPIADSDDSSAGETAA